MSEELTIYSALTTTSVMGSTSLVSSTNLSPAVSTPGLVINVSPNPQVITIGVAGAQGIQGATGPQGPSGVSAISTDAGNIISFGTDSGLFAQTYWASAPTW